MTRYNFEEIAAGKPLNDRCAEIADQVVPEYRSGKAKSCTGIYAKRWDAAWNAAAIALGAPSPTDPRLTQPFPMCSHSTNAL